MKRKNSRSHIRRRRQQIETANSVSPWEKYFRPKICSSHYLFRKCGCDTIFMELYIPEIAPTNMCYDYEWSRRECKMNINNNNKKISRTIPILIMKHDRSGDDDVGGIVWSCLSSRLCVCVCARRKG